MGEIPLPRSMLAMIDELPPRPLRELESALASTLYPYATAAERRQELLGALMGMLSEAIAEKRTGQDLAPARIPRELYDAERPPDAPPGRVLVELYGSWAAACRAALSAVGFRPGRGRPAPWPPPLLGRERPPEYTRDEVLRAVRRAAEVLGRDLEKFPSHIYYLWAAKEHRRAREAGAAPPRLPAQPSVERHFKSWRDVRKAAAE